MIILRIRIRQLLRELNNLGLYLLFYFFILIYLITVSYILNKDKVTAGYQLFILCIICLLIQLNRNDKKFIYLHLKTPHLEVYYEYFAITLPFAITVLLFEHWYFFLLFQFILALIPFFPNGSGFQLRKGFLSRLIEPAAFEYISGIRHSSLFPIYLLALSLSWLKIVPLVLIWIITAAFASFYNECEPIHILRSGNASPRSFLYFKTILHMKYLVVLYLPILIVNTIFNPSFWWINFLFLCVQLSILMFALYLKYSCYSPNERLRGNNIILSIVSMGVIFPFFLPVPLIMAKIYYGRAFKNMQKYL